MDLILIWSMFIVAVSSWRGVAGAQRCYVCIPNVGLSIMEVLRLFPSGPPVPLCNQFKPGKKEFVRDCPSDDYVGCITETNGTHVTKRCAETAITDCNTANNISYCYCEGDLCNAEPVPEEQPRPAESLQPHDDDEDLSEGSGDSEDSAEITARLPTSIQENDIVENTAPDHTRETAPKNYATTTKICLSSALVALLAAISNL